MARTRVRWGRVGGLAVAAVVSASVLTAAAGAGGGAAPAAYRVHVVRSGETLWGIAQRLAGPTGDPRPVVDRLIAANHLAGSMLRPGDRLVVSEG